MGNKKSLFFLVLISFALLFFFTQGNKGMDKFDWLPTECAPKYSAMQIIRGDLIFNNGKSLYIPDGKVVYNGWGQLGSTHVVGEDYKPLPVKLDITWFSYMEDKFYSGSFDLPYDKILSLFKEGFVSRLTGEHKTYDTIMVGLAPGGEISVWLMAEGLVLEVAAFRAEEAEIEWKNINNNPNVSRKDYIQKVIQITMRHLKEPMGRKEIDQLVKDDISGRKWAGYRKQYLMAPEVIGATPLVMWLRAFNGESEYFDYSRKMGQRTHRPIPKKIIIDWQNKTGKKYTVTILFDEQEIFQAYQNLSGDDLGHNLQLEIEINETSPAVDVFLKDAHFILKLEKITMEVFRM